MLFQMTAFTTGKVRWFDIVSNLLHHTRMVLDVPYVWRVLSHVFRLGVRIIEVRVKGMVSVRLLPRSQGEVA